MVDWGGLFDKGVDKIGDGVDKGKELLGEGIDHATDKIGQGLEKIGAHEIADKVEDWGDGTASALGAQVGEQQLGQTEEADELIHGKPEKIAEAVKNLRDFQKAFDLVGSGMRKLDSGHWKGEAADAFREKFSTLPTDWLHAADAMENAAKALETYSKAVVSAQGKAREAIALYKEGDGDSKTAVDTYNKKVDAYNAARTGDNPLPDPGAFSDPGKAKRQRAKEILNDARTARNEAGDTAKAAVSAALAHAPKEPTGRERAKLELMDYGLGQGIELAHFGGGVVKGTAGLLNFVRSVNPVDPYNLTHPAEYYKGVNMTLMRPGVHGGQPGPGAQERLGGGEGRPVGVLRPAGSGDAGNEGRGRDPRRTARRLEGRDQAPAGREEAGRQPRGPGEGPADRLQAGQGDTMREGPRRHRLGPGPAAAERHRPARLASRRLPADLRLLAPLGPLVRPDVVVVGGPAS